MNLFCTRRARFAKAPPGGAGFSVPPRKDRRGVDLIRDALPFGRLWYGEPNAVSNAIGYAMHRSRSHHAVIRVYDATGNVIEWAKKRTQAGFMAAFPRRVFEKRD